MSIVEGITEEQAEEFKQSLKSAHDAFYRFINGKPGKAKANLERLNKRIDKTEDLVNEIAEQQEGDDGET